MTKFAIVSISPEDLPKNVPPSSKLKVYLVTDNLYSAFFQFKEGSLNEGSRNVRTGIFNCAMYKNKKDFLDEIERRRKVYSKKDFNSLHAVEVSGFFEWIQAEMAIRNTLTYKHNFKEIYDGSPFAKSFKIKK